MNRLKPRIPTASALGVCQFGLHDTSIGKDLFYQDGYSLAGLTKDEIIECFRESADKGYFRRIMGHMPGETEAKHLATWVERQNRAAERARQSDDDYVSNWVERAKKAARARGIKIIEKDSDLPFAKEPIDPRKKKKNIGIIARLKRWLKGDVGYKR